MKPRYKSLASWVRQVHPTIPANGFETVHLDELGYPPSVFRSITSLEQLTAEGVSELQKSGAPLSLLFVMPLEAIEEVGKFPNPQTLTLKEVVAEANELEPPSFYLMGCELCLMDESIEEYRCPVHWEIPSLSPESYSVYFRIYREQEDIENNWEYYRSLRVHWSPLNRLET